MPIESSLSKILHADDSRISRFHTSSGQLVLSPDIFKALSSTLARHLFDQYQRLPWLTYPAIRFLRQRLQAQRLLEFGSGTSTAWFGKRCREVHSVENNADWFRQVKSQVGDMPNVHANLVTDIEMVSAAASIGGRFDAIIVDCQPSDGSLDFPDSESLRIACLRAAIPFASDDCIFVIDNTDTMGRLGSEVRALFSQRNVQAFPGWVPGIFHPNETTIVT